MNLTFANIFGLFSNPVEIIAVGGVILLLFGGKQIPTFFRSLGDGMKEFKKATREMQDEEPKLAPAVASPPPMSETVQPAAVGLPADGTPHTAEAVHIPAPAAPVSSSKE